MGMNIWKAIVSIRGDSTALKKDFLEAGQSAKLGLGGIERIAMSTWGAVAGMAGSALSLFGMLKKAGAAEQTFIAFETMIGSAEKTKKTLADLKEFAAKTPFEMPEIKQAAQGLIQFGERGNEMMETLKMLGNAASGTSTPFGFLALIFNQVRGVGKLLTQDFRQLSTRGIISLQDIADYFDVTTDKAQEMLSTGEVSFRDLRGIFRKLSDEGGRYHNLMEKQSQSMFGLWSTLTDAIGLTAGAIGEKLMPHAKALLTILIQWVENLRESAQQGNGVINTLTTLVIIIGKVIPSIIALVAALKAYGIAVTVVKSLSSDWKTALVKLAAKLAIAVAAAIASYYSMSALIDPAMEELNKAAELAREAAEATEEEGEAVKAKVTAYEREMNRIDELNRQRQKAVDQLTEQIEKERQLKNVLNDGAESLTEAANASNLLIKQKKQLLELSTGFAKFPSAEPDVLSRSGRSFGGMGGGRPGTVRGEGAAMGAALAEARLVATKTRIEGLQKAFGSATNAVNTLNDAQRKMERSGEEIRKEIRGLKQEAEALAKAKLLVGTQTDYVNARMRDLDNELGNPREKIEELRKETNRLMLGFNEDQIALAKFIETTKAGKKQIAEFEKELEANRKAKARAEGRDRIAKMREDINSLAEDATEAQKRLRDFIKTGASESQIETFKQLNEQFERLQEIASLQRFSEQVKEGLKGPQERFADRMEKIKAAMNLEEGGLSKEEAVRAAMKAKQEVFGEEPGFRTGHMGLAQMGRGLQEQILRKKNPVHESNKWLKKIYHVLELDKEKEGKPVATVTGPA